MLQETFVLSVIQRPEGQALYGKAKVFNAPFMERRNLRTPAYRMLREHNPDMDLGEASRYAEQISRKECGFVVAEASTGLRFRVDQEEAAPHACPCCKRLVLPTDHAYADKDDAFCLGCFTWSRDIEQCLPENTAHAHKGE
jgi:hypothetical protein